MAATQQKSQIRMAMAVSSLMMVNQVASKATRDGIFLSQFSSSALPTIVVTSAIVGILMSMLRARSLVRTGPFRITPMSFAISGVLQLGEWALLGVYPRVVACVLYLHVVAFGAILLSGFWSVMNESFDPREAKKTFGLISGWGTLGGLCGGLMAAKVAAWFSPAAVVLVLAILHLVCAMLLWRSFPQVDTPASAPAVHAEATTVAGAFHRYPFLIQLAGLVLAASVGAALLDFVFKAQAAQTFGRGASLVRFFGLYYTGTSLLIFLVQTFLTRFTLQHAGLAASASVLPATAAAGSLIAIVFPGFRILTAARGAETLMRGSISRSATELFYTAVAPAEKRAVKPVIDVGVERLGDVLGGGAVSLLLAVAPGRPVAILASACACSLLAFLLTLRLQRGYLQALEKSMMSRAVEIDPEIANDVPTQSLWMQSVIMPRPATETAFEVPEPHAERHVPEDAVVRKVSELRSGDAARVTDVLDKLDAPDWTLAPLVIELLAWDEAMPAARNALQRIGPSISGLLVDVLLHPGRDFTVRRRIPRVLAMMPSMRSVEGLFAALEDPRFEVRFYSGRALYLLLRDHPELIVAPERIWEAVNRELSHQKPAWNSHRLLDSRDTQSKEWFFDDQLMDRADRNLEHLFTLLSLLLPVDAVRIAFRALHTDDRQLKGTAFEYLESATPSQTRQLLLPLLEADAENRQKSTPDGALGRLMQTQVRVNERLNLEKHATEAGR